MDPTELGAALDAYIAGSEADVREEMVETESDLDRLLASGIPGTPATEEILFERIRYADMVTRALAAAKWPDEIAIVRRFAPPLLGSEGLAMFGAALGDPALAVLCDFLMDQIPESLPTLEAMTSGDRTAAAVARAIRAKGAPAVPLLAKCLRRPSAEADARAALRALPDDPRALVLLALDDPGVRLRGLEQLHGEEWLVAEVEGRESIPPEFPLLPFLRAACRHECELVYAVARRTPPWTDEVRDFLRARSGEWLDRLGRGGGETMGVELALRAGVAPAGTAERVVEWLASCGSSDILGALPPHLLPDLVLRRPDLLYACVPFLGNREFVERYVEACEAAPEEEAEYSGPGSPYGLYRVRGKFAPQDLAPLLDAIGADEALRRRVQAVLPKLVRELYK